MTEWMNSFRLVTFLPAEALNDFIKAISDQIPSLFGEYDRVVWWSAPGTEQYREKEQGGTIRKPSVRIEISLPRDDSKLEKFVTDAIKPNHPWDEPVILVYESRIARPD